MKNKTISIIATWLLLSFIMLSCKKNGTGGGAMLHVMVYHHARPVNHATIYIKYGAQHQPADPTTQYDQKVEGELGENHVHIENLRAGNYYLYAVGHDDADNLMVEGGTAVKIRWSERMEMKNVELDIH